MANSDRVYKDKSGNIFIPMNVEGLSWSTNFMTTPKILILVGGLLGFIFMFLWLSSKQANLKGYIVTTLIYLFIYQFLLRYIVFEERYYHRMYKYLKENEITTMNIFWDIVNIRNIDGCAILTYSDGKVGVIMKVERDTITGKPSDFKETHYDAISDFYKELIVRGYSFIQLNIMEQAGNDSRLAELDKLTIKDKNPNVIKLMEKQVGYIKNIAYKALYESDYFLIYTRDTFKVNVMIEDIVESVYKLFEGAFIGYRLLNEQDIVELIKEQFGVKYFNCNEATIEMFNTNNNTGKLFTIEEIILKNGEVIGKEYLQNLEVDKLDERVVEKVMKEFNSKNGVKNLGLKKVDTFKKNEGIHTIKNNVDNRVISNLNEEKIEGEIKLLDDEEIIDY
ncbi:MAG: hypothetical protein QXD03_02530 [Candidatus Anstonellales archaeon]